MLAAEFGAFCPYNTAFQAQKVDGENVLPEKICLRFWGQKGGL
jgi:hypothetical protein